MRSNQARAFTGLATLGVSAAIVALTSLPLRSQEAGNGGSTVAVSNELNDHIHTLGFESEQISRMLSGLSGQNDSVRFESSSGFDGGPENGVSHSHEILFDRDQLTTLSSTGDLTVESESSNGHTHRFSFIKRESCPAVAVPVPSPTTSPSASPSAPPSPQPSGVPTGIPSGVPSGVPSGQPSGVPMGGAGSAGA